MSIEGRGHIDIDIKDCDVEDIIGKLNELEFDDIMVTDFCIDFTIINRDFIDYTNVDLLRDWLLDNGYSFRITVDEWIQNNTSGYYYDSDEEITDDII